MPKLLFLYEQEYIEHIQISISVPLNTSTFTPI